VVGDRKYRGKPDKPVLLLAKYWKGPVVGLLPQQAMALVAAWADLGEIANLDGQKGAYCPMQLELRGGLQNPFAEYGGGGLFLWPCRACNPPHILGFTGPQG